jgi:hypothetical protein
MGADKIATGHNADDIAESVLLNFLRGDISRLGRCVSIITGEDGPLPRSKPFKYTYEKEIVLYAYFKKLVYFSTECIYAPNSYRGHAREYLKNLEASNPQTIISTPAVARVHLPRHSATLVFSFNHVSFVHRLVRRYHSISRVFSGRVWLSNSSGERVLWMRIYDVGDFDVQSVPIAGRVRLFDHRYPYIGQTLSTSKTSHYIGWIRKSTCAQTEQGRGQICCR